MIVIEIILIENSKLFPPFSEYNVMRCHYPNNYHIKVQLIDIPSGSLLQIPWSITWILNMTDWRGSCALADIFHGIDIFLELLFLQQFHSHVPFDQWPIYLLNVWYKFRALHSTIEFDFIPLCSGIWVALYSLNLFRPCKKYSSALIHLFYEHLILVTL